MAGQEGTQPVDGGGKLDIRLSSNEHAVRLDFERNVGWIALPKEHAIRLALLILEHAGARIEPPKNPTER